MKEIKDIVIYGTGAIGTMLATFLQLSNKKNQKTIYLVGRKEILQEIETNGLIYVPFGSNNEKHQIHTTNFKIYESIKEIKRADVIFLTLKAQDLENALINAHHLLKTNPYVIITMNGLGLREIGQKFIPNEKILESLAFYPCKLEKNIIFNSGANNYVIFQNNAFSKELLPHLFSENTLKYEIHVNFKEIQWKKAIMNIGMNAISAITLLTVGQVLERKTLGIIIKELINETLKIANLEGIEIDENIIEFFWESAGKDPNHRPSTQQDLLKAKSTEIDFMNGYIVKKGMEHQVDTPINNAIITLIHLIENKQKKTNENY